MIKKHHKFLASPLGSYVRHFAGIILALWFVEISEGRDMWSTDIAMLKRVVSGAVISVLPVIINWLNPANKNYGK